MQKSSLRDWRESRGLTKKRLSEISGISRQTITKIEKAQDEAKEVRIKTTTLSQLAGALKISARTLIASCDGDDTLD